MRFRLTICVPFGSRETSGEMGGNRGILLILHDGECINDLKLSILFLFKRLSRHCKFLAK